VSARCPRCGHVWTPPGELRRVPMTKRQFDIYRYLITAIGTNGFAPSHQEIADHFGYRSLATVSEHLHGIERREWIRLEPEASRGITCLVALDAVGQPAESVPTAEAVRP
jgi:SOS-response transcriptional repressor LexA